jgi:hypothetical protein
MNAPLSRCVSARGALAGTGAAALALALGACGASTVSTSGFQGEQRQVAQAISNLQSDVSTADQSKICDTDLARAVVARLNAAPGGCKAVIKEQLAEIDSSSLTIKSVQLGGTGAQPTATATVRSTYGGKTRSSTVSLRKEEGKWKVSGVY